MAYGLPSSYPYPSSFKNIKDVEEYQKKLYASLMENDRSGEFYRDRATNPDLKDLMFRPEWYGAKGDGVTDDTRAFNSALAGAATAGTPLLLGAKAYYLVGPLTAITTNGLRVVGATEGQSIISLGANDCFTVGSDSGAAGAEFYISNVKFEYNGSTKTAVPLTVLNWSGVFCDNIRLNGISTFMEVGSAAKAAYGVVCNAINGNVYNGGLPTFKLISGAGFTLRNSYLYVDGVGAPTDPASMTTVAGTDLVSVTGSWDSFIMDGNFIERYYRALYTPIAGPGLLINVFVRHNIFDYIREDTLAFTPTAGTLGTILIQDNYLNSWEGHGISFTGAGLVFYLDISGNIITSTGKRGISLDGTAIRQFKINENEISHSNRLAGDYSALFVHSETNYFTIANNNLGRLDASTGLAWQAKYGLEVGDDCHYYNIIGNSYWGSTDGCDLGNNMPDGGGQNILLNIGTGFTEAVRLNTDGGVTLAHFHSLYGSSITGDDPTTAYLSLANTSASPAHTHRITAGTVGSTNSNLSFYDATDAATRFIIEDVTGNIGFNITDWGGTATKTIAVGSGSPPTANPVDGFQMWGQDITSGNAAPHFATEAGDVVKLYKFVDARASAVANSGDATTDGLIDALRDALVALGLIAAA